MLMDLAASPQKAELYLKLLERFNFQGMNDLVTPFFLVFLQEAVPTRAWQDLENYHVASLRKEERDIIEADSFWCLSKFLDGIQDNYIFAQLGIQHKVNQLKELIQRIDGKFSQKKKHLSRLKVYRESDTFIGLFP